VFFLALLVGLVVFECQHEFEINKFGSIVGLQNAAGSVFGKERVIFVLPS
jgi:hypothetical protein